MNWELLSFHWTALEQNQLFIVIIIFICISNNILLDAYENKRKGLLIHYYQ